VIEEAVTEPSGLAVPITETGAPGLRPASPEVVTVAVGGTVTVTVFPAKLVSVSRSALTEATAPTAIGASPPPAPAPDPAAPPLAPAAPPEPRRRLRRRKGRRRMRCPRPLGHWSR
jgi:hypothetical protein